MTVFDLLFSLSVPLLASRLYLPWTEPAPGDLVRSVPLPLLARLRMQRGPALTLLLVGLAGLVAERLHLWSVLLVASAVVALIALPVSYRLTDQAIRLAQTRPRRWTEFGGVARRGGGARLQGISGGRGMTVWLSGSRDDDDHVLLLRRLVRGAYKGEIGPTSRRRSAEPPDAQSVPLEPAAARG